MFNCIFVAGFRTSRQNEPNTKANPRTIDLHPTVTGNSDGRRTSIRLHLHPAVFHPKLDMVLANVLHVRLSLSSVHNTGDNMRRDDYFAVLFPLVRWRLPLVVAIFPHFRLHRRLSLSLLLPLFLYQTADWRFCLRVPVFRVYHDHGVSVQPLDRVHRVFRMLLVH